MAAPSPLVILVSAGTVAVVVGSVVASRRYSLTVYHIPRLVLVLLAITSGLWGVFGVAATSWESGNIEYTATRYDSCSDTLTPGPGAPPERQAVAFDELSPKAQEIFQSTIRVDGSYTSRAKPDDFELRSDLDRRSYVRYESDCYELVADSGSGLGSGLAAAFYFVSAVVGVTVFTFASWFESFKSSTSVLAGLGSGAVVAVSATIPPALGAGRAVLAAATATLVGAFVWLGLRLVERSADESFRQRMRN